jgi:large subunit ribosomal protein L4
MANTKKVTEVKTEKTEAVKAPKATKTEAVAVTTYSLLGKEAGTLELPKAIFEGEINKALIAQAIRVYTNNEKGHFSNTKTRGEVTGSTRKIYKQKGTGRARHGSIMAPIFVGGGIALGPKSRITNMELPKKMKKAALVAALREKYQTKELSGVDLGKLSGKTKEVGGFLKGVNQQISSNKKTALIVVGEANELVQRATRNVQGLSVMTADEINVFEVIKHQSIFMTLDSVTKLEARLVAKKAEVAK